MAVNLGSTAIAAAMLGSTAVDKIMLGSTEVYAAAGGGGSLSTAMELTVFTDSSFSATTFETAQFTPTAGATLVIFIGYYSTDDTPTVTIGSQSRTFGTGTSLSARVTASQGDPRIKAFIVENASATAQTIQLSDVGTPRSVWIGVYECANANTTQSGNATDLNNGPTGTSESFSLTVTDGSVVLYAVQHEYRGEAYTWTGATELTDTNTGGTNNYHDFDFSVAWELVSGTSAGASCSWTTASNNQGVAIEVLA